jgi:predicted Zn finger-like uncharacterized protein
VRLIAKPAPAIDKYGFRDVNQFAARVGPIEEGFVMTTACPHCAAPTAFSAEPVSSSGRMMRCARCGTSWLARLHPDGSCRRPPALRHGRPRFERIIEHAGMQADASRKGFANAGGVRSTAGAIRKSWIRTVSRRGLATWSGVGAGVVLTGLFIAAFFNATGLDAATESGSGKFAGLEVRMLEAPGIDEVAFRLADRRKITVGMR